MLAIINVLFNALCKSHQEELAELKGTGGGEAGGYMCIYIYGGMERRALTARGITFFIEMKNSIVQALGQVWNTQSSGTSEWPFI